MEIIVIEFFKKIMFWLVKILIDSSCNFNFAFPWTYHEHF